MKKDGLKSAPEKDWRKFDTGAQRDTGGDKLRMSLVPTEELRRLQLHYLRGSVKYGVNNWKKGMPLSVYYDSLNRHLQAWWDGDDDEDHAAAVLWNMMCAMYSEKNNPDLDDRAGYPNKIVEKD